MKRICIVGGMVRGGGISHFMMSVYTRIDTCKDIKLTFVNELGINDYKMEMKRHNWTVYYITPLRKNVLQFIIEWKKFLDTHKKEIDIIHFHDDALTNFFPIFYAKKIGITSIVVHSHNSYNDKVTCSTIKKILHKCGRQVTRLCATSCLACSYEAGTWFFNERTLRSKRFKIVKNGIELHRFKFNAVERKNLRKQLGIEDKYVIGHVGRFDKQKNHQFLIKIFKEIRLMKSNAFLILIGTGPLEDKIKWMVNELHLNDSVAFLGYRNNVAQYYNAMDLMIFPSLYEGLPISLIEAQTSGVTVISSDNVTKEVKCTDQTYFYSLKTSEKDWAKKIISLQVNLRRDSAYEQVKKCGYDIKDVVSNLTNFYLNASGK